MNDLRRRFDEWMAAHDSTDPPATPAATVLVLRDADDGPEVLMVQRSSRGAFASAWVFPGGKVDEEDFAGDPDVVAASSRAACREALEEADVVVDETLLVPFSHWMPPIVVPRRFSTWFFVTRSPGGIDADVTIDGGEIVDHLWIRPADALDTHRSGGVELVPPTWVTLNELAQFDTAAAALEACTAREPFFYLTKMLRDDHPTVAWHGDAGYESGDATLDGARHRLVMDPGGWRFDHTAH